MDRDLLSSGFLGRSALPIHPPISEAEGETMQAIKTYNGSPEHRIAEALQEAEVSDDIMPSWQKIVVAAGLLVTLVMLVWILFK